MAVVVVIIISAIHWTCRFGTGSDTVVASAWRPQSHSSTSSSSQSSIELVLYQRHAVLSCLQSGFNLIACQFRPLLVLLLRIMSASVQSCARKEKKQRLVTKA